MIVNAKNFVRAETDTMFARLVEGAGTGQWHHFRQVSPLDQQPIIRQNRDTLYSTAIVDVRDGIQITLPEADGRYLSVMVVNQDHYIPVLLHEAGVHDLSREDVGTDFVMLGARVLVNPNDPTDVSAANRIQDGLAVSGGPQQFVSPEYDEASYTKTRDAVLALAKGIPGFDKAFGRSDEVEPIMHLLGTAAGWGGLPEYEATYISVDRGLPVAEYRLRLESVPVDAFWSVSLYNADGYFEVNDLGVNSINSITATPDPDGAVTIRFGVNLDGAANALPIMAGWNYVLRLYQPRPSVLDGSWTAPEVEAL